MSSFSEICKKYKKYKPLELLLAKPAMFIGGMDPDKKDRWIVDDSGSVVFKKDLEYSQGLFQIFLEILTNAIDQSKRCKNLTQIKVNIDTGSGRIEVYNNGDGIPAIEHEDYEGKYIPEMLFSDFATSSNYNDKQTRIVAGTHGIGAKATSVFSNYFKIETVDAKHKRHYSQIFKNNLSKINKPKIKEN